MGKSKEMQFRNFGAESTGSWQGEISGAAAAQGKIGGAEVWTILKRFGAAYIFNNQAIFENKYPTIPSIFI